MNNCSTILIECATLTLYDDCERSVFILSMPFFFFLSYLLPDLNP